MRHSAKTSIARRARSRLIGCALLLAAVAPAVVRAQTVTLPTMRTAESRPEVELLRGLVSRALTLYPAGSVENTELLGVLSRIVDAPLTPNEKRKLQRARTTSLPKVTTHEDSVEVMLQLFGNGDRRRLFADVLDMEQMVDRAIGECRCRLARRMLPPADSATAMVRDTRATPTTEIRLQSKDSAFDPIARSWIDGLVGRYPRAEEVNESEIEALLEKLERQEGHKVRAAVLDSLRRSARAAAIHRKIADRILAPVHSREHALAYWRQPSFSTLNVGAVSGSNGRGAAFTELASPFMHTVRMSINTVIVSEKAKESGAAPASAPNEETSDAAVNRFLNGGGQLNVAFAWPALHAGLFRRGMLDAALLVTPRLGATLPALGASARDSTIVYDLGTELHLKTMDAVDGVGLFAQSRVAWAGGTGNFGELLGVGKGENRFWYSTLSAGFYIGGKYLITASRTLGGPRSLRALPWQVGVTMARSAVTR